MATAVAKLGAVINFGNGASVTVFEGDLVENLVYTSGAATKTVSGSIRVINATTRANSTIPESCPPEPYVHRYITINSLMIDSSEVYDAEMTRVNVGQIVSIGSINGETIAASVNGENYATVQEALDAASSGDVVTILNDFEGDINLDKSLTIIGTGSNTIKGSVNFKATGAVSAVLQDLILDGADSASGIGINSQNAGSEVSIGLLGCTIKNFAKKGIYMTNAVQFLLDNLTVQDCATAELDAGYTQGDHAIDLNLVGVQGARINMAGVVFDGICGRISPIRIAQRGGPSDPAIETPAKISSVKVSECNFAENDATIDITIGMNGNGDVENTTGAFPCTIGPNVSSCVVHMRYNDETAEYDHTHVMTAPAGQTIRKDANTDFYR